MARAVVGVERARMAMSILNRSVSSMVDDHNRLGRRSRAVCKGKCMIL